MPYKQRCLQTCLLEDGRHFNAETKEWVYTVDCYNPDHEHYELWEMFRESQ